MESWRRDEWQEDSSVYSADQVEAVLDQSGIEICSETGKHFLVYCPFHGNNSTPAALVNKTLGTFNCMNGSCDVSCRLEDILQRVNGMNIFQARRFIRKVAGESQPFEDRLREAMAPAPVLTKYPQGSINRLHAQLPGRGMEYMESRGFSKDTCDFFEIGYSDKQDMVIVPMHDAQGVPIGFIGRSIEGKNFKNSTNLPRRHTMFNLHRAKVYDTVYVTEACFDGMSIYEATGTPNFVSTLGPISPEHYDQLDRYFSNIIIATDNDEPNQYGKRPGRDMGANLVLGLRNKRVLWATYDTETIYPDGHKDLNSLLQHDYAGLVRVLKDPLSPYVYNENFQ